MDNEENKEPRSDKLINSIKYFWKSVIITWESSRVLFAVRAFLEIISAIVPIVSVWLLRVVINAISSNFEQKTPVDYNLLISIFTAYLIINIVNAVLGKIKQTCGDMHTDKLTKFIDLQTINKINELDISYYDDPKFYDEMINAQRDSAALQTLAWLAISLIRSIVQIVSCALLLGTFNILIPVIVVVCNIPPMLIEQKYAKLFYNWQRERAIKQRKINYFKTVLNSRSYSKEVRIYNLFERMVAGFETTWNEWFTEKKKFVIKKSVYSVLGSALPQICSVGVLLYIALSVATRHITIGDFTYFNGLVGQFTAGIAGITSTMVQVYQNEISISNYMKFLSWKPRIRPAGNIQPSKNTATIEFRNVSFKYPQTDKYVLQNVSFKVYKNEKIGIVGQNGAGKTTMIKLLLRLYDPTEGRILLNGVDIADYDSAKYSDLFGVVFQDYSNLSLTIRENIAMADVENMYNQSKLEKACEEAGAMNIVNRCEHGFDTYLNKVFDKNGAELSGGEWQRMAIARAYFKSCPVVILDEPSSSLDPEAEYKVFQNLYKLSFGKTALFVSHRLSSVVMADKLIVMENGKIIETGTHPELIEKNGRYAEMFNMQAENYRMNKVETVS